MRPHHAIKPSPCHLVTLSPCHLARPAFTLFEVVLVLALVLLLVSIAYPSLDSMYSSYRVTAAVDMVRGAWAEAQSRAMNEGRAYRFSVRLNQGSFRVAPDSAEFWGDSSSSLPTGDDTGDPPLVFEDSLPKRVSFTTNILPGQTSQDQGSAPVPAGGDIGSWMPLVTFLPDGTTREDVEIAFQSRGARAQTLKLRSLTGTVLVKPAPPEGGRR
jgi:prepilin-type N-terminal cleavage/methylation domain-containing protein